MPKFVWDKQAEKWVDREETLAKRLQVVADIEPYKTVTGEVVTSRREHKEFLRRGGYVEVGNEKPAITRGIDKIDIPSARDDIRRAANALKYGMAPTQRQLLEQQRRMKYE